MVLATSNKSSANENFFVTNALLLTLLGLTSLVASGQSKTTKKVVKSKEKVEMFPTIDAPLPATSVSDTPYSTDLLGERIVVPEGFKGILFVEYDAKHSADYSCCPLCEINMDQRLQTIIPKIGYKRYACSSQIHEKMLSEGKLEFFSIKAGQKRKPMKGYQYQEYLELTKLVANKDTSIQFKYKPTDLIIVPLGFLPANQVNFEQKSGIRPEGRVACFRVGTVKEIFKI